jgi:alpha-galactosidase
MKYEMNMPQKIKVLAVLLLASLVALPAINAAEPARNLAPTPPMGWNSYDSYGVYLHEKAAFANLEAMAEKLKPHGYEYFVIDNGWFGEYALQPGTNFTAEKDAHDVNLNAYGQFLPSKVYFPNGFKPLVERCHALGLKFGVHLMRGIPRKAYELNLPIQGTTYTARDIANTEPKENCKWCTYCYAVDMSKPGAQEWYDGLIQHVVDLGVDFIKYDDIVPHPDEVEAVVKAIRKTGKPVVLSLSPGGKVDPNAINIFKQANMLRVTGDVWDDQRDIDKCFTAWRKWQGRESSGFWIDMDMIPFGQLQLMSPPGKETKAQTSKEIAFSGKGNTRWSRLTKPQMKAFITMRALAASPLMMGGDLPSLDAFSYALITNPDMLACNQNGVMGSLKYEQGGLETWRADKKGSAGEGWIGVFNRTDRETSVELTRELLGLDGTGGQLTDVWNAAPITLGAKITLPPQDVLFLKYKTKTNAKSEGCPLWHKPSDGQDS